MQADPTLPEFDRHPWYGPCDGFGPNNTCCECTGIIERKDGSWIDKNTDEVIRKPPLRSRVREAWRALTYNYAALNK